MREEDFTNISGGEPLPLLEEGIYLARAKKWFTRAYSWGEKLNIEWQVYLSPDCKSPVPLYSHHNVKKTGGGQLYAGPHSAYYKDWIAAHGGKLPQQPKRLSPEMFLDKRLFVNVVTVKRDQRGPLNPSTYYSRVGQVMRPLDVDEQIEGLPLELVDFKWKTS